MGAYPKWEEKMETDPNTTPPEGTPPAGAGDAGTPPPAPSAEQLQKELDKWKALSRKNEDAAKANAAKAKSFDELEDAKKTDIEKIQAELAKAQKLAADESLAKQALLKRALAAEVSSHAAAKFADADVAIKLLGDVTQFTDAELGVDVEKLTPALDALLEQYPYLARGENGMPPRRMQPNPGQNPGGAPPASLDQQIQAATAAGNHMLAISLKRQKAASAQ